MGRLLNQQKMVWGSHPSGWQRDDRRQTQSQNFVPGQIWSSPHSVRRCIDSQSDYSIRRALPSQLQADWCWHILCPGAGFCGSADFWWFPNQVRHLVCNSSVDMNCDQRRGIEIIFLFPSDNFAIKIVISIVAQNLVRLNVAKIMIQILKFYSLISYQQAQLEQKNTYF